MERGNSILNEMFMVGQAKFSYNVPLTAVIEVEAILNFRPLSYILADDLEEPLTP